MEGNRTTREDLTSTARSIVAVALMIVAVLGTPAVAPARSSPKSATPLAKAAPQAKPASAATTGAPTVARYRVAKTSVIDLGWTGIAHGQEWQPEQRLEFALACGADGACAVSGGEAGMLFGAPTPLSAGGVPVCAVSRLRTPLAGSVTPARGCGELRLALQTTVHTAADVGRPCPVCVGDGTPNDGKKDGHCDGGDASGAACDANGVGTQFGATSNDCLPSGRSAAGALAVDLAPLTTGKLERAAETDCKRRGFNARCYCAGQPAPNECDDGTCGAKEVCANPFDGACTKAPYRPCTPGTGDRECEAVAPGAGVCEGRARRCFGDRIVAQGRCDRAHPTYVAIFCTPPTQAPAINSTAGLPGPARLRLVLDAVP